MSEHDAAPLGSKIESAASKCRPNRNGTAAIPISLRMGFLGAGKSALPNVLLASEAFANTAAVITAFGDIAIDPDLVGVNTAPADERLAG